ncbi:hypothetical protein TIFTF001_005887 [Ficus carica]|uniref:Uncharacterized protein n=1 Tax=Ficus carica TaxID=3494 RepID=A0AA88CY28_FICCA|nr:hypothetical protein TIFTF001_005887 [Ficus carica]
MTGRRTNLQGSLGHDPRRRAAWVDFELEPLNCVGKVDDKDMGSWSRTPPAGAENRCRTTCGGRNRTDEIAARVGRLMVGCSGSTLDPAGEGGADGEEDFFHISLKCFG